VFAGNPYLISPDLLVRDGFLAGTDLNLGTQRKAPRRQAPVRIDFANTIAWKMSILDRAYARFRQTPTPEHRGEFEQFHEENSSWLRDFSIFMAIKEMHAGSSWICWEEGIRLREPAELRRLGQVLQESILRWSFYQMLFFRQWAELHQHAHRQGVRLIGDVPIFAAEDSADVWAHPELFCLDGDLRPTAVSGVPPDYFAPTGQLWGNPVYDWEVHSRTDYSWWLERLRAVLQIVDIVRIDHFRGLAGYWEVPAGALTAQEGSWAPGPGAGFLDVLQTNMRSESDPGYGRLPFIAEDLGVVTPDVAELLERYGLPGMRVLQFGFAGLSEDFLPHNYARNCVVYTGTHDNDTSRGWFAQSTKGEQRFTLRYLHSTEERVVQDMIRANWESPAAISIVPLQDLLGLGTEARMNLPGRPQGNWEWRFERESLSDALREWILRLNDQTGRSSKVGANQTE